MISLSNRLQMVASLIPPSAVVADVGTDHGYLPVWLLQSGRARRVLASDIHAGPLRRARQTAAEYAVEEQIEFALCDGLQFPQAERAETIVIAGMGGETMISILRMAPWTRQGRHIILQPQSKRRALTAWLQAAGYTLQTARLCEDGGMLYHALAAFGGAPAEKTTAEALLFASHDPLLPQFLAAEEARLLRAIEGMSRAEARPMCAALTDAREELERIRRYKEAVTAW